MSSRSLFQKLLRPARWYYHPIMLQKSPPHLTTMKTMKVECVLQNHANDEFEELSPTFTFLNIRDEKSAKDFINRLYPNERKLLFDLIQRRRANQYKTPEQQHQEVIKEVHHDDLVGVWWMTYTPFFLYGLIDNTAMIVAGESFDLTIGQYMGISVMAGAAAGNIVSNLIGIYFLHYVEIGVAQVVEQPKLMPGQENLWAVRFVKNLARLSGILSGCVLGMFPLLFYTNERQEEVYSDNQSLEKNEHEFKHDWLSEACQALSQPIIQDGLQHDLDASVTADETTVVGESFGDYDDKKSLELAHTDSKLQDDEPVLTNRLEY